MTEFIRAEESIYVSANSIRREDYLFIAAARADLFHLQITSFVNVATVHLNVL